MNVVCLFVRGEVPYTVEYVHRLRNMVSRWIDRPHTFKCLTDQPNTMPDGVEAVPIQKFKNCFAFWTKLELFNPERAWSGRVLYLDLDVLITAPLAPIIDFSAPFSLIPHAGSFNGKNGLAVVKRFNSSCMVWDAGCNYRLYDDWAPSVAKRLHGDQDWIGEQFPKASMFPLEWFPRISELQERGPSPEAKVVLAKTPKNVEAAKRWDWARQAWEAA